MQRHPVEASGVFTKILVDLHHVDAREATAWGRASVVEAFDDLGRGFAQAGGEPFDRLVPIDRALQEHYEDVVNGMAVYITLADGPDRRATRLTVAGLVHVAFGGTEVAVQLGSLQQMVEAASGDNGLHVAEADLRIRTLTLAEYRKLLGEVWGVEAEVIELPQDVLAFEIYGSHVRLQDFLAQPKNDTADVLDLDVQRFSLRERDVVALHLPRQVFEAVSVSIVVHSGGRLVVVPFRFEAVPLP